MTPFTQPLRVTIVAFFIAAIAACTVAPDPSPVGPGSELPGVSQNAPGMDSLATESSATDRPESARIADTLQLPVLRIWLDCSTSDAKSFLRSNIDSLISALDRHKHRIAGVEVVCFSNGDLSIWAEVPDQFIWGSPPPVITFVPNFDKATPKEKMFKESRDDFVRRQQIDADKDAATRTAAYNSLVKNSLAALSVRLLKNHNAAPCTRFGELSVRMQHEHCPLNPVLSDGYADCPGENAETVKPFTSVGRVAIIQIPANGHTSESTGLIDNRKAFLQALFPNGRVFPVYVAEQAVDILFD